MPGEARGREPGFAELATPDRLLSLLRSAGWLGRQDSNLGMAESKSAALPLGYAPKPYDGRLLWLNRVRPRGP